MVRSALLDNMKRGIDKLVILTFWILWKEHNNRVFNSTFSLVQQMPSVVRQGHDAWHEVGVSDLQSWFV